MLLSEFSERLEEASDLGLRMLETGSILSKSAEATFAFQKLLVGIIPEERHVKLLLISKHVDAVFILRKWSRSPNDHNHIMSLVLSAAKSLESDASKNIINPKYISQVKDIVRQLRDAFQRG